MKELPPQARILIIRLSAIGDVVRTLPAAALLRKNYPRSYLVWLVEEKASDVLKEDPILNEVWVFPRKKLAQLARNPLCWWELIKWTWQFTQKLREKKFDLILDFHGIFKSGFLGWLSGAPLRVGYARAFVKELNGLFTNFKVPLPVRPISRHERNFALIQTWVSEKELRPTPIVVPIRDQARMALFLRRAPKEPGRRRVLLHPGASKSHKRWFAERYAQVADALIEAEGAQVVLTWGPNEKQAAEAVRAAMQHKEEALLSPELSLKQLAELASQCDLFISTDSGPMHIAAAMGARQIALFGPTDPAVNLPNNPKAAVLYHKVPCSPCRAGCPDKTCLKQITAEEVLSAACETLTV